MAVGISITAVLSLTNHSLDFEDSILWRGSETEEFILAFIKVRGG